MRDLDQFASSIATRCGVQGCRLEIEGSMGIVNGEVSAWWFATIVHGRTGQRRLRGDARPSLTQALLDALAWVSEHEGAAA